MGWWPSGWRLRGSPGTGGDPGRTAEPTAAPATPSPPSTPTVPPLVTTASPDPGWRGLAPLQRSWGPIRPVAPLDRFTADLRSHQNPSFLGALSHLRSADGPSGLAELVRVGAPLQRVAHSDLVLPRGPETSQHQADTTGRQVQRFAASPVTASTRGGSTATAPEPSTIEGPPAPAAGVSEPTPTPVSEELSEPAPPSVLDELPEPTPTPVSDKPEASWVGPPAEVAHVPVGPEPSSQAPAPVVPPRLQRVSASAPAPSLPSLVLRSVTPATTRGPVALQRTFPPIQAMPAPVIERPRTEPPQPSQDDRAATPPEASPMETTRPEPATTEPAATEPTTVGPVIAEPDTAEPVTAEQTAVTEPATSQQTAVTEPVTAELTGASESPLLDAPVIPAPTATPSSLEARDVAAPVQRTSPPPAPVMPLVESGVTAPPGSAPSGTFPVRHRMVIGEAVQRTPSSSPGSPPPIPQSPRPAPTDDAAGGTSPPAPRSTATGPPLTVSRQDRATDSGAGPQPAHEPPTPTPPPPAPASAVEAPLAGQASSSLASAPPHQTVHSPEPTRTGPELTVSRAVAAPVEAATPTEVVTTPTEVVTTPTEVVTTPTEVVTTPTEPAVNHPNPVVPADPAVAPADPVVPHTDPIAPTTMPTVAPIEQTGAARDSEPLVEVPLAGQSAPLSQHTTSDAGSSPEPGPSGPATTGPELVVSRQSVAPDERPETAPPTSSTSGPTGESRSHELTPESTASADTAVSTWPTGPSQDEAPNDDPVAVQAPLAGQEPLVPTAGGTSDGGTPPAPTPTHPGTPTPLTVSRQLQQAPAADATARTTATPTTAAPTTHAPTIPAPTSPAPTSQAPTLPLPVAQRSPAVPTSSQAATWDTTSSRSSGARQDGADGSAGAAPSDVLVDASTSAGLSSDPLVMPAAPLTTDGGPELTVSRAPATATQAPAGGDPEAPEEPSWVEAPLTGQASPLVGPAPVSTSSTPGTAQTAPPVVPNGSAPPVTPHGPAPHATAGLTVSRRVTTGAAAPQGHRGSLHVGAPVQPWAPVAPGTPLTALPGVGTVPLQRMFAGSHESSGPPLTAFQGADTSTGPVRRLLAGPPVTGAQVTGAPVTGPTLAGPSVGGAADATHDIRRPAPALSLPVQRATGHHQGPAAGPSDAAEGQPTGGFSELVIQRQSEAGTPEPSPPAPPLGEPGGAASPGPQAAASPGPQAAAATTAMPLPSGRDLDALAERLYEPLSARLRAELWLDRERSGLMVDLRR